MPGFDEEQDTELLLPESIICEEEPLPPVYKLSANPLVINSLAKQLL
jgi:hypothetical protein